jgi:hypothetical protein
MKSLIVIAMLLVLLLGLSEMSRCSTNSKKSDTTCWLPEAASRSIRTTHTHTKQAQYRL